MTFLLAIFAVLALGILIYATSRHRVQIRSLADFQSRWNKVDLEAFANLVDPGEERFLRERLPAGVYRSIHRARLAAAWEYLGRVGLNAQLMIQAGQIIERHNTGAEAERARRHVDAAIELRNAVFFARCSLGVQMLMPGTAKPFEKVLRLYGEAAHSFDNVLDPAVTPTTM
jgi:hypothetical protein